MDPTTGPRKTNFGYNRFADLFYYLLAHMPLDCAADVYDAEYVAQMAGELGVSPQVPQRLTEYYQEHFDRLNIINFFPLAADNIRHLREGLASCGQLTEEDMSRFVDPLLEICERVSGPFYKWWEQHHAESAERKEKVYDRFSALAARFAPFLDKAAGSAKVLFSYSLRKNGRAFFQPDGITVYLTFPEKDEEIAGCFLQYLHECTHRVTDPLMNRNILMADGSHDISESQVLCFDEYLIEALAPDMAEIYRAWISREYLDYSHERLGAEGEQRLKDCLKEIIPSGLL